MVRGWDRNCCIPSEHLLFASRKRPYDSVVNSKIGDVRTRSHKTVPLEETLLVWYTDSNQSKRWAIRLMRSLVSLLLIPLAVLGQCLSHAHLGIGAHSLDDHSSRPHIHLSGGHLHNSLDDDHHDGDHHHDGLVDEEQGDHHIDIGDANFELPQWVQPSVAPCSDFAVPTDHDSDAIYFADPSCAVKLADSVAYDDLMDFGWGRSTPFVLGNAGIRNRISHPPDRFASLPIFLTVNSLLL